jgi:signal transduction histidine kinase
MNHPIPSAKDAISHDAYDVADNHLRGRWLILARAAWLAIGALATGLFIAGIQAEYRQLLLGCPTTYCASSGGLAIVELSLLEKLGISPEFFATYGIALELVFTLVFFGVAALIFWQKSSDRPALFVSFALLLFGTATQSFALSALVAVRPFWGGLVDLLHFLGSASFSLFLFIFPDGRFVPRWTRWVALVWIAWLLPRYWFPAWPPSGSDTWLVWPNLVVWLSALGGAVYSQVYRYRHVSNTVQQQQTKWVVFGIAMGLALFIIVNIVVSSTVPVPPSAGDITTLMAGAALMSSALLLIPLSIGIAMLRHHLFDVDVLINRTLVYLTLTAIVVGTYMFMVGYLSTLFHAGDNLVISILAAGCVAVLFAPLRDRLQRGVNRLMYGERDDPYTALTRLGRRLEASLAPESVLSTVVTTVREVLKLPYVAIYLKQDHDGSKIVAESASPSLRAEGGRIRVPGLEREGLCVPLIHQGETLGYIVLGPRAPNEAFSSADLRLLDDLAPQVGAAVHAVRLTTNLQRMTEDLQRSREHLVNTREEERRRLRRDLHDGLGPTLASLAQRLDTARILIPRDPNAAVALLGDLTAQVKTTITDIRRLVYALRPPALDELGLVSALREHAAHYNEANGLSVSMEAPERLPPLPAAVEVAAYRIVLEALTNVARHAHARTCHIHLELREAQVLYLEVTDDGGGLPNDYHAGVGLASMRERAMELGGECRIEPGPTHGIRVVAWLPLPKE